MASLIRSVGLVAFLAVAQAHDINEHGEIEPASIANTPQANAGQESYIQKHMATEHHIGAFDLGSFFSLHDLNRDGVWDRSEIEAIYGVHHSTSAKHSANYEVHDEKANKIVSEVLRKLDYDRDGLITKREFESGGPNGLPSFQEFGKNVLGHHYDEESEYFVHHEEIYHNTPDKQTEESYTHPEDIAHFAHHDRIEAEEEQRERKAEGMPTMEEDARRKAEALAKGEKYESPYEAQIPKEGSPVAPQYAYDPHAGGKGYAQREWHSTEHVFKTPQGEHVVKSGPIEVDSSTSGPHAKGQDDGETPQKVPGETDEGYKDRLAAWHQQKEAAQQYARVNPNLVSPGIDPNTGEPKRVPGESLEDFLNRKSRAKFAQAQARPAFRPANKQDLKKSAPNKYPPIQNRLKKSSFFGEF